MIFKKIFFCISLMSSVASFAQEKEHQLYVKGNALFLPVGILNAGLEYQLSPKYTFQTDVFISPWKSFAGNHAQIYMGHLEGRYYFKEAFHGWYVGANAGTGVFDVTKWNYSGTDKFQRGFTFMLGGTAGYQFKWKENWNIDVFLGAGTVQSYYHGYENVPPDWIRYDKAEGWNRSGEFLPYRGGIMLSYKIK